MNLIKYSRLAGFLLLLLSVSGCLQEPVKVLKVGEKAPPLVLELLDNKTFNLANHAEKPHVITFMSSWCPCSNESIPLVKKAYQNNKDSTLQFLMVGIQDSGGKFGKFADKWQLPFAAGFDKSGQVARNYGVTAPPTTIFIDKKGNINRVFFGNIAEKPDEFKQWIKEIL